MNGSSLTLDKVSIQIEANAKTAGNNINELSSTLNNLRESVKGGFNNIAKLAQSLEQLKTASNGLQQVSDNLSKITDVTESMKSLNDISPKGFNKTISSLEKLPKVFDSINPQVIANVARVSNELSVALTPLADKLEQIASGFSAVSNLANTYGVSVTKVVKYHRQGINYVKMFNNSLNNLSNGIKKATKSFQDFGKHSTIVFKSFLSKLKQIGLSLLGTRTIFTATRKAVSEYMALDEQLTWEITNVWRALGAQLAPAIEYVIYLFKQFVRVVYSIILALTGIDLISRANEKAMKGWGKAAKDTLGNLQKFDDLNVVEFPSSGSGAGDDSWIDLDTIDLTPIQKIIDWVIKLKETIKEAWDTGQWYGVGKVLGEGLNAALGAINTDAILAKFKNIAKKFGDFLQGVIDEVNWELFGTKLTDVLSLIPNMLTTLLNEISWEDVGNALNRFLKTFSPADVLDSMLGAINTAFKSLDKVVMQLDFGVIGEKISDVILTIVGRFNEFINIPDWKLLGEKIREGIESIDWSAVWDSIEKLGEDSFENLKSFFEGLTGLDSTEIGALADALVQIGEAFVAYKLIDKLTEFTNVFAEGASAISPWAVLISGIATIILEVKKAFDAIDKGDYKKAEDIANGLKLLSLAILSLGLVIGVVALLKEKLGGVGDSLGDAGKATKDASKGFSDLFGNLGKAAEIIAILGGLALVITSITELIKTFSDSGMSLGDSAILLAEVLGAVAVGFTAIALASKLIDTSNLLSLTVIFVGLTAVLLSTNEVLKTLTNSGMKAKDLMATIGVLTGSLLALVIAFTAAAVILGSNPLALIAILALAASISAVLLVVAKTLPTILDAVGKFINDIAPSLVKIITAIFDGISKVVYVMNVTLPPVINAVGNLFDKVFKGIDKIINTVGKTIVNIMNTAKSLITTVLQSILNFINNLGPAINKFVDNAIRAVTKLINFIISGIEFTINTLIINSINSLLRGLNKIPGVDFDTIANVKIQRFVPQLETGTNEIPYEGLYHLHPGEAVVPKQYNPALGGGTNEDTNRRLDALIDLLQEQEHTTVVNIGNKNLYKETKKYNTRQVNKYGTIAVS